MRPRFRPFLASLAAFVAAPLAAQTLPAGFVATDAITGLNQPSAVRFARDGRVFVAEQSGLLWVYPAITGGARIQVADLRRSVHNFWDRGLLGLALDPDFPDAPFVYVLSARPVTRTTDLCSANLREQPELSSADLESARTLDQLPRHPSKSPARIAATSWTRTRALSDQLSDQVAGAHSTRPSARVRSGPGAW